MSSVAFLDTPICAGRVGQVTEVELSSGHVALVKFPKDVPFAVRDGNANGPEEEKLLRLLMVAASVVTSLAEIAAVLLS